MRTTLTIDDVLLQDLRRMAKRRGVSLKEIVNQALRRGLAGLEQPPKRARYRGRTFSLGTPRLDVDKALAVAASLEDEEIVRKVAVRK